MKYLRQLGYEQSYNLHARTQSIKDAGLSAGVITI